MFLCKDRITLLQQHCTEHVQCLNTVVLVKDFTVPLSARVQFKERGEFKSCFNLKMSNW